MSESSNYLLSGGAAELERLQLQARVWEPEAEIMLDTIGIQPGWRCADLGCGAFGILGALSKRVGPHGQVIGVDLDAKQLAAARLYVHENHLSNVEIVEQDAYHTSLPRESFDLTHVRFVFAPAGRDEELLREVLAITCPDGIVAIQEPDMAAWNCYPSHPAWTALKDIITRAFVLGGGDFNVGQRTFGMLRRAGLHNVHLRAAVVGLQDRHPYMRLPIQFATSLRKRIVDARLADETALDELIAECEQIATNQDTIVTSFLVMQVWGWKPR